MEWITELPTRDREADEKCIKVNNESISPVLLKMAYLEAIEVFCLCAGQFCLCVTVNRVNVNKD